MARVRRINQRAQVPFESNYIFIDRVEDGTFRAHGQATRNGEVVLFKPLDFSDLNGALAIATYWAEVHEVVDIFVFDPGGRRRRFVRRLSAVLSGKGRP